MQYLPLFCSLSIILLGFLLSLRQTRGFLKDIVTIGTDQWTWTTRSGELYEDVEIERLEGDELVLKHKFGISRLAVDRLSDESRDLFLHSFPEGADSDPAPRKITSFNAGPQAEEVHATQAA